MRPKDPQNGLQIPKKIFKKKFCDFSYINMTYLKWKKNNIWVFWQWFSMFRCRRWCGLTPPQIGFRNYNSFLVKNEIFNFSHLFLASCPLFQLLNPFNIFPENGIELRKILSIIPGPVTFATIATSISIRLKHLWSFFMFFHMYLIDIPD